MGDFIDDFIQEYKRQPSLWQTGHPDFKNRKKRQEAYMKLIEVANKHNEAYNIERTKQKINNLRCAFRVQLKKYNEVKKNSKDGKEETYCPKRKYFESLMFLLNEETSAAKANGENKKMFTKETNVVSRTRNKTLSRKKIDKELEAITLDLQDELDPDENFLTHSVESEKENKLKSDSFEENEESFNLALIEDEENLSVCNAKDIDPDAFESIIEEDEPSNKESQTDFIKVTKSSPKVPVSKSTSTANQPNNIIKSKTPLVTKQNKSQSTEDKIVLIQSNPSTSTISITTTSAPSSTTVATRSQFRQAQAKPISQNNISKLAQLSHVNTKNSRIVEVRSIKTLTNSNLQPANSPQKPTHQQTSNTSSPQKRLSTGLATPPSVSSSITLSSPTSKANIVSPIITQKVVTIPKVTSSPQQITIRSAQAQIPARTPTISSTGVTLSTQNNSNGIFHNNDAITSQHKKIKLDFDSSNLEKILSLACSKLKQEENEDDFTVFGRMVTCKLKTMETGQAIIAQKLITDVLFDGQMKFLQLPKTSLQKTVASSLPQIITRTTPISSLRQTLNSSGQTFFISEMDRNADTNVDSSTIQLSTGNNNVSADDC
ncbi:uncharacterized protein LOC129611072 [Condylostylus longicornis]|uniref:uncharacterized protein LOC129611072 n=1 Tax=Condylostylus longicornis TaxID=2530218 RepID=UPI00244DF062|nr:uncharacterized protein LOC129611072 [Condylostylus longicornis]